ncbi:coagulation factor V-like [Stylophora pistillata]|uniref:Lactadherin n=1 Tax=Stylophora pistillata TaxID=50429 RepID=A0A2B4RZG6_STYPI|nr:coagulation factor V-like [Stylophora pistillata]PFX23031.1 Lactadherin [Stylophora pistillata]
MRWTILLVFVLYFAATEEAIADCLSPLGLASGSIHDSQLSASTSMSDWLLPSAGRLHNNLTSSSFGAWCAEDVDLDQWFQIDLLRTTNVSAVASQGIDIIMAGYWVASYSLNYSCDGIKWHSYAIQGAPVIFQANNDSDSAVTNTLSPSILARFIRVLPLEWNQLETICLRLELYGCEMNQACPHPTKDTGAVSPSPATAESSFVTKAPLTGLPPKFSTLSSESENKSQITDSVATDKTTIPIACSYALGMQSGAINESQIKASSFDSLWTRPSEARLHNQWSLNHRSLGGWCAADGDMNPFLQVDLLNNFIVTAIATQGVPANGNIALRYKLNYSCDGINWFEYQEGTVFEGYRKNLRARQNKLPVPFKARLVRIRPLLSRQYEIPCVRLEIYGCRTANSVCGTKNQLNTAINPDQHSSANTKTQTIHKTTSRRNQSPTRPKDMIVIVRDHPSNDSLGYNFMPSSTEQHNIFSLLLPLTLLLAILTQ